jgi:hypothetical protein
VRAGRDGEEGDEKVSGQAVAVGQLADEPDDYPPIIGSCAKSQWRMKSTAGTIGNKSANCSSTRKWWPTVTTSQAELMKE